MLEIVNIGEYTIDFSRQRISKGTEVVTLSKKISGGSAWKFLEVIMDANGRILTYEVLDELGIWRDDGGRGVDHRASIKTWVSEFNKVFEEKLIKNKSGVGYYFDADEEIKPQAAEKKTMDEVAEFLGVESHCDIKMDLMEQADRLYQQMETLVTELETIQKKIDLVRGSNSAVWEEIYAAQFEAVYFKFRCVEEELGEKRIHVCRLRENLMASDDLVAPSDICSSSYDSAFSSPSTAAFLCIPSYDTVVMGETQRTAGDIFDLSIRMTMLSEELDYIICGYRAQIIEESYWNHIANSEVEILLDKKPED